MVPSLKRLLAALRRLPGIGAKSAQRIGYHLLRADDQQSLELARSIVNLTRRVGLCSICGNTAEVGRNQERAKYGGHALEDGRTTREEPTDEPGRNQERAKYGGHDLEGGRTTREEPAGEPGRNQGGPHNGGGSPAEADYETPDGGATSLVCDICADPERDHGRLLIVEEPYNVEAFERTGVYDGYYHVLGGLFDPLAGIGAEELSLDHLVVRLRRGAYREVILATSPTSAGEATASYLRELLEPLELEVTRIAVGLSAGADVDYADEVSLRLALEGRRRFS
ncbi:MAG: recombination protein RecR [Candidatus Coatesbacteria bacterium]|nr:recombination protein RecR [Candidatus Coatesbacteria bacterium]